MMIMKWVRLQYCFGLEKGFPKFPLKFINDFADSFNADVKTDETMVVLGYFQ